MSRTCDYAAEQALAQSAFDLGWNAALEEAIAVTKSASFEMFKDADAALEQLTKDLQRLADSKLADEDQAPKMRLCDLIFDMFGPGVEVSSYEENGTWEMSLNGCTGVGATQELALDALARGLDAAESA